MRRKSATGVSCRRSRVSLCWIRGWSRTVRLCGCDMAACSGRRHGGCKRAEWGWLVSRRFADTPPAVSAGRMPGPPRRRIAAAATGILNGRALCRYAGTHLDGPTGGIVDRRRKILGDIPLPTSWGLEIGPLHTPLVRRSESRVLYVDYASTEMLRANFRHPGDPGDIVDVDIVWGDRPLRECVGTLVDYVVASHVIEHVPDLIGWLLELRAVLK